MATITEVESGSIDDLLRETRAEAEKEKAKEKPQEKPKPAPKPAARTRGKASLKEPLTAMYGSIGAAVFVLSPADGLLFLEHGERCAETLDELGKQNPKIRSILEKMVTTSAMGAVITAHMPIILGILANHDMVPHMPKKAEDGGKTESQNEPVAPVPDSGNRADYVAPTGPLTPVIVGSG